MIEQMIWRICQSVIFGFFLGIISILPTIYSSANTLEKRDKRTTAGNGKISTESKTTIIDENIIIGHSYPRLKIAAKNSDRTTETADRADALIDRAREEENYANAIANSASSTSERSYCESIGGSSNAENLFTEADNGTFGEGTAKNQFFPLLPLGLTTYSYANRYPPNDDSYVVSTHSDIKGFGTWHNPYGHTTGRETETDRFLVVNAHRSNTNTDIIKSKVVSGLLPHTNYVFTAYILNLVARNRNHIDPNVSFGIDLIGVDDDGDGAVDEQQEFEVRFVSGDIDEQLAEDLGGAEPSWKQYAYLFNTGSATSARFIIRDNKLGGFGNDLALDDITLKECSLPSGNLSGTLYYDNNRNEIFDSQEMGLGSGSTIRLIDTKGTIDLDDDVVVTRTNSSGGTYSFNNVPASNNYQVLAPSDDGFGNFIATTNPRRGISITAGSTTSSQDFGYNARASLLLVKRITAINPGQPNEIRFDRFINDPNDANDDVADWPNDKNVYLRGEIDVEGVEIGDEVEYSIYFLANGSESVKSAKVCDVIPDEMTFVTNSYGTQFGIGLGLNKITLPRSPNLNLSNVVGDDRGDFYDSGTRPPSQLCKKIDPLDPSKLIEVDNSNNVSGAIVVDLGNSLPPATSSGNPPNSYGFIRFRGKIE